MLNLKFRELECYYYELKIRTTMRYSNTVNNIHARNVGSKYTTK
jgi:hypothetical protein